MPRTQARRQRRSRRDILQQITEGLDLSCNIETHDADHLVRGTAEEDITQKFSVVSQCWQAVEGGYTTTCKLFSAETHMFTCAIMHEPTHSASFDDLPQLWPMHDAEDPEKDSAGANTVQLECSHFFYAPALAFHFLIQDMRCPVCRKGSQERMQLQSVPASVRDVYAAKVQASHQNSAQEDVVAIHPLQIHSILSQLEVEMRIFAPSATELPWSAHSATARSRVVFEEHHVQHVLQTAASRTHNIEDRMTTNFAVHRSFQRLIRSIVGRHFFLNTQCTVRFALTHPLLPVSFVSNDINIGHLWLAHFTVPSPDAASIPLFCSSVSGVDPVAFIRTMHYADSHTTSITVDMNIHIIMNILTYISDVLDSIQNSVQMQMSLELPVVSLLLSSAENAMLDGNMFSGLE